MTITKASVFIRTVGLIDSSASFYVAEGSHAAFSAANFSSLTQDDNYITFTPSVTDSYHAGCMQVVKSNVSSQFGYLTYPITAAQAGKYYVYIRVKNFGTNNHLPINYFINDVYQNSTNSTVVLNQWGWVSTEIVIKDDQKFNLTIQPTVPDCYIDTIVITQDSSLPSSLTFKKNFCTLHCKLFNLNSSNSITSTLDFYSYKTTLGEITNDGWYNFALDPLPGYTSIDFSGNYALGLFISGASDSLYLAWDYADESTGDAANTCILSYNDTTQSWTTDCTNKYAVKYYTHHDPIDETTGQIVIPPSNTINKRIELFDDANLDPTFLQAKIVAVDSNSNKVALNLSDRLVSIVVDQSGSQTWNDNPGLRHVTTRRMIDRLEATYPGVIKYNLATYGATPIQLDFFAVVESDQVNTSSSSAVAQSYFSDQESGYAGVRIVRKLGSYPVSPLDGEVVAEGLFQRALDEDLTSGETYYYAAYTYNSDGVFSDGKFLYATPHDRILPQGAGNFTYRVVVGTGIKRDANTVALWHTNESDGNVLYDFSDSNLILNANKTDLIWLNKADVPNGTSGLRLDGTTRFSASDSNNLLVNNQFTIMSWIYPFNFASKRVILSRENTSTSKLTFKFGIDVDGLLFITLDDVIVAKSDTAIVANSWQHVTATVDVDLLVATFYIDGEFAGTAVLNTGAKHSTSAMPVYVGGATNSFLGKITEISVHNTIRSTNYIVEASTLPASAASKVIDNGDRLVILKYLVSSDFNYSGGNIKILRKEAVGSANFDYNEPQTTGATSEVFNEPILTFNGFGEHINNEFDGSTVFSETATSGEKVLALPFDYVHARDYYFRIFTKNTLGNTSSDSDSPELKVTIPQFESVNARDAAITIPFLPKIQNVQFITGNAKAYITWDAPTDENVAQIQVFWSDKGTPIIDGESKTSSSAILVYSDNSTSTGFVDRNIENLVISYYSIVAVDKYGNFSQSVNISVAPSENADESLIPLLEVKNFHYEIVNPNAISLAWDAPVKFQKDIDAYFDERIVLYAQLTDDYGSPISDLSNIKFTVTAKINSDDIAEDVFAPANQAATNFTVNDTYVISSTVLGDGVIKGIFRMTTNPDILSAINYLYANITVSYFIPDKNDSTRNVFEMYSLPIRLRMLNPFGMEIVNVGDNTNNYGDPLVSNTAIKRSKRRSSKTLANANTQEGLQDNTAQKSGDKVRIFCKKTVPLDDQSFIASGGTNYEPSRYKDFDGCYIRRSRPYTARVIVTYKNQPLPQGSSCNVAVYEASDPQCDPSEAESTNPCATSTDQTTTTPFVPTYSNIRSKTVQPPATSIVFKLALQTLSDGSSRYVSYADVPLKAPASPQAVMLFAKANFANSNSRRKAYVVFANILRIETTIEPPQPNCVDVAEQFANVYLVNPDSPDPIKPNITKIKESIPVRWEIRKGLGAKDRPFYTTDNVPIGPGIFSYARNGNARKVFFGPACGVQFTLYTCNANVLMLPELYAIKASVVYDGLQDFEERPAIIYPQNVAGSGFGSRFLISLPQYYNPLYADGYTYIKGTIYHDPSVTGGQFGGCFLQCASDANRPVFSLTSGQLVDLESGDAFEIFYGDDITLEYDEDIDETLIKNGTEAIGFAQIPLSTSKNYTDFYLRINKFVGTESESGTPSQNDNGRNLNPCLCVELPAGLLNKKGLPVVRGTTTINYNGDVLYLQGGGDFKNGIPPTVIELREPLSLIIRDIRRNGVSVETFLCDGVSTHEIIVELAFKDKPVPNGTAVFVAVGGKNPERIVLQNEVVYTEQKVDLTLDNIGNIRSYASVFVLPINNDTAFESQIRVESNYDKRGDADRSISSCLTIKFDPSIKPEANVDGLQNKINNIYDSKLEVYDTVNDSWSTKTGMNNPRGCLSLTWGFDAYGEQLFAIGGMNGQSILATNEAYDVATDSWQEKTSMSIPRFYHMSAYDGNYVYVFGGITVTQNVLEITRVVERYDIANDSWEVVASMPVFDQNPYGVALGSCVVVNSKAYIIGGITKIGNKGSIDALNDRILIFDFDTLEWSYSSPFTNLEYEVYCRISPFVYVSSDASTIHVLGGSVSQPINQDTGEQSLDFPTETFAINVSNLELSLDDSIYTQIPRLRYRGGCASVVDKHYFLGGTTKKSLVSNIFEVITENVGINYYAKLDDMLTPKTSFGYASDNWQYIYVCGGLNSGRPKGFIQIKADVNPINVRLDGKQSSTLKIELINDIGERPDATIRVLVQGIVTFPDAAAGASTGGDTAQQQSGNSALRDALIYPVVFSSHDLNIENGLGSTILLPRSDDILKKVGEIKQALGITDTLPGEGGSDGSDTLVIKEGQIRYPYTIQIRITVLDSFYYGQTVVDVKDNEDEAVNTTATTPTQVVDTPISQPTSPTPTNQIIFTGCREVLANNYVTQSGNGTVPTIGKNQENNKTIDQSIQSQDNPVFDLNPPQSPQFSSPEVSYYSDIEWIPQSKILVQFGTYDEVSTKLNILKNEIPFGASPLYDCLQKISEISVGEELDPYVKVIYLNTDNEQSMSLITLDEAIESIQAIDGYAKTPVVINNFSVVSPITLSALVSRTDTDTLERLASETGGQSQTILDEDTISVVLNNSIGRLQGSIGYGLYECVVDVQEDNIINTISADFELFANTDANWSISTSSDGYSYNDYSDMYGPNETITFDNLHARFIKFKVTLLSGLSASIDDAYELIPSPGVPALTGITIKYSDPTVSYIYLNQDTLDYSAQQIAIAVSANQPKLSTIEVGATSSNSFNWDEYQSGAQPTVDRFGKVFIPIRYNQSHDITLNEPLDYIDGYVWKARYGRWDTSSSVYVYDATGTMLESDLFDAYPQDGLIVFKQRYVNPLTIGIENAGKLRVGLKITNKDAYNTVKIDGLGYMYNTNVFLPAPLSQRAPVVTDFAIVPSEIFVYETISLTYKYFDLNNDAEITEDADIRWYINGVEIEYLRGLRTWNDITNVNDPIWTYAFSFTLSDVPSTSTVEQYAREKQESIIKVDDLIYATIRVTDGNFYSDTYRSQAVKVIATPPFINAVVIKGMNNNGQLQDSVTSTTRAVADFGYFADENSADKVKSQIVWYVNNVEFKRGNLNETVNGISNNQIIQNETVGNVVGITYGNVLQVVITPVANDIIGSPVSSESVTVQNDPPKVSNVVLSPNPRASAASSLQVTYTYTDRESIQTGSQQSNQSSTKWYRAVKGSSVFEEVVALQNATLITSVNLSSGQKWKAEVIPFDGFDTGTPVQSNVVEII
jgi:hypothetical protein